MGKSLSLLGCPPEKTITHHLGVQVGQIPFQPRSWTPGEPFKVLIAAGFREKKGIPYALDALARIRKDVPLQITIIGDAEPTAASRAEKQKILERIQRHDLGSITRLLGYQPFANVRRESSEHHLFLAPSVTAEDGDSEGGAPVAVIDAAASGMPVVSSFHCDIPDVIRHGQTGWLAEERNVDAIVEAIGRWLNASPEQWLQWLTAGRRHAEQEYDAIQQGQRLAEIYRRWR
jgi:colanic acid/amylovoran biosynthesis glycosyltransferase